MGCRVWRCRAERVHISINIFLNSSRRMFKTRLVVVVSNVSQSPHKYRSQIRPTIRWSSSSTSFVCVCACANVCIHLCLPLKTSVKGKYYTNMGLTFPFFDGPTDRPSDRPPFNNDIYITESLTQYLKQASQQLPNSVVSVDDYE